MSLTTGAPARSRQLMRAARGRYITVDGVDYPVSFSLVNSISSLMRRPAQLYVMSSNISGHVRAKIGQSKDAWGRLYDIQMASPFSVRLEKVWNAYAFAVCWAEKHAHDLLDDRRSHGEWFKCGPARAVQAVNAALEYLPLLTEFYRYNVEQTLEWKEAVRRFRASPEAQPPPDVPIP